MRNAIEAIAQMPFTHLAKQGKQATGIMVHICARDGKIMYGRKIRRGQIEQYPLLSEREITEYIAADPHASIVHSYHCW